MLPLAFKRIVTLTIIICFLLSNVCLGATNNLAWISLLIFSPKMDLYLNTTNDNNPFSLVVSDSSSQEKYGVIVDRIGLKEEALGIIYMAQNGEKFLVTVDPQTGLPTALIAEDNHQVTFTNYTSDSVTISLMSPTGIVLYGPAVKSVNPTDINKMLSLYSQSTSDLSAADLSLRQKVTFVAIDLSPEQKIILEWVGVALNWTFCLTAVIGTPMTLGAGLLPATFACGSAILSTSAALSKDPNDAAVAFGMDAYGCGGNVSSCLKNPRLCPLAIVECAPAIIDIVLTPDNQQDCEKRNGTWINDKCIKCNSGDLASCTGQDNCEAIGAHWYDDTCINTLYPCNSIYIAQCKNEKSCDEAEGFWYNDICNRFQAPCGPEHLDQCFNEADCTTYGGGYWYNDRCNSTPLSCSYINLDQCTNSSSCTEAGGYWYNDKCNRSSQGTCNSQEQPGPDVVQWKGREWQRCAAGEHYDWEEAKAYCQNLTLAGNSDWSLPTKDDMRSLVVCTNGTPTPLVDRNENNLHPLRCRDGNSAPYDYPTIDPQFWSISWYWFWSSSAYDANYGWIIDFSYSGGGGTSWAHKTYSGGVRCVR